MEKQQFQTLINFLRAIKIELTTISSKLNSTNSGDNAFGAPGAPQIYETSESIQTYTLNCDVCGKVIYRRDPFDTRCDEHPN